MLPTLHVELLLRLLQDTLQLCFGHGRNLAGVLVAALGPPDVLIQAVVLVEVLVADHTDMPTDQIAQRVAMIMRLGFVKQQVGPGVVDVAADVTSVLTILVRPMLWAIAKLRRESPQG